MLVEKLCLTVRAIGTAHALKQTVPPVLKLQFLNAIGVAGFRI